MSALTMHSAGRPLWRRRVAASILPLAAVGGSASTSQWMGLAVRVLGSHAPRPSTATHAMDRDVSVRRDEDVSDRIAGEPMANLPRGE